MSEGKMSDEELERALSFLEHHERIAFSEFGQSRASASVRAHIATLQREADGLRRDKARLDWLEQQTVEVWTPLPAGAQRNFMAEGNLRSQIDARSPQVEAQQDTSGE